MYKTLLFKDLPEETQEYVAEKAYNTIIKRVQWSDMMRHAKKECVLKFLKDASEHPEYGFCVVFLTPDGLFWGVGVFSLGECWYNDNIKAINEELTIGFRAGFTRVMIEFMQDYCKEHDCNLITASVVNDEVSPAVTNSYLKYGFKQYNSFYKQMGEVNDG